MLEVTVLISELLKANNPKRKDPMADPLEGAEWQGLLWTLRLFGRRRAEPDTEQQDRSGRTFSREPAQRSALT
jgi:hypothetical protein